MLHTREKRSGPGSIAEMKRVCQQWTQDRHGREIVAGSWFNRCILRRISIYVTWVFVALGIGAHIATLLMIVAGCAGIALCISHSLYLTVMGGICFMLFDLFDAVDGEIARWNKTSSTKGLYLDQISHVLIMYPSFGVPALHYYLMTGNDVYWILAGVAVVSALMGRTFREVLFRINAETLSQQVVGGSESVVREKKSGTFTKFCHYLRAMPLTAFPIDKGRVIHIVTVIAILVSYAGSTHLLIFVSWFYAIYCATRTLAQIPHYFWNRIIDVEHTKSVHEYKWPI